MKTCYERQQVTSTSSARQGVALGVAGVVIEHVLWFRRLDVLITGTVTDPTEFVPGKYLKSFCKVSRLVTVPTPDVECDLLQL